MNAGNTVQDAVPPAGHGCQDPADNAVFEPAGLEQTARPSETLADIQELIDKLAAVTRQLRHPRRG